MTARFKHGAAAYKHHGCRCDVCRAGNTEAKRRQRARGPGEPSVARGPRIVPLPPVGRGPVEAGPVDGVPGAIEAATTRQVEDMADAAVVPWTAEAARWERQALTLARNIDEATAAGRAHVTPPFYRLLNDALDRLGDLLAPPPPGRVDDDAVPGADDFARSLHTHSVRCLTPCRAGMDWREDAPGWHGPVYTYLDLDGTRKRTDDMAVADVAWETQAAAGLTWRKAGHDADGAEIWTTEPGSPWTWEPPQTKATETTETTETENES